MAKYEALLMGLHMPVQWKIIDLHVCGDSQLIINQVNDHYNTIDGKLMSYKRMVDEFNKYFNNIFYQQIPRVNNKAADVVATIGSIIYMLSNVTQFELLVGQLMVLTYEIL